MDDNTGVKIEMTNYYLIRNNSDFLDEVLSNLIMCVARCISEIAENTYVRQSFSTTCEQTEAYQGGVKKKETKTILYLCGIILYIMYIL